MKKFRKDDAMNELKVFDNGEFGQVRSTVINKKDYFVANDVARALGYSNPSKATNDHCKNSIMSWGNDSLGRKQEFKVIPEGDVYRLITHSKLPSAERFERWVFDEVLPSIRNNGTYMTDYVLEKALNSPDFLIQLATKLKKEKETRIKAEAKIEADRPKVVFADAVSVSKTCILIGDLAKLIKQNGIDIGQKRLFGWLRTNGYLIKRHGYEYNSPTQRSMEMELFEVKETTVTHSDGHTTINKTTKVTGKGQQYFINKFLMEGLRT
jgi:anti-repressor protein